MTYAHLIDFLSATIVGLIVTSVVLGLGGPTWAAAGLGLVAYLAQPPRAQERARHASTTDVAGWHRYQEPGGQCAECGQLWPCQSVLRLADKIETTHGIRRSWSDRIRNGGPR